MNKLKEEYRQEPLAQVPLTNASFTQSASDEESWPEPLEVRLDIPSVQALDLDILPECLRQFVADEARRKQVPLDMVAIATLCVLAGATGRRVKVQPKEYESGWQIVPTLWGGIVAPPSSLKSPVLAACVAPLYEVEAALPAYRKLQQEQQGQSSAERDESSEADKKSKTTRTDAAPATDSRSKTKVQQESDEPQRLKNTRLIVNDATFEILHELMAENPDGLFKVCDELTSMFVACEKKGREGERQYLLECWNPSGHAFKVDRIGRGAVSAKGCLSIVGGIQPEKLRSYGRKWLLDGSGDDGLLERFQLLTWPNFPEQWVYIDETPDLKAAETIRSGLGRIVGRLSGDKPLLFRFNRAAQDFFKAWLTQLELRLRTDNLSPRLHSHLGKFRGLMPSLACLFQLAELSCRRPFEGFEGASGEYRIDLQHARAAASLCSYLESHANRIYAFIECDAEPVQILARHVKSGKLGNRFSARDIKQKEWKGLKQDKAVEQAIQGLIEKGWLKEGEPSSSGGRATVRYRVNPKVAGPLDQ